MRRYMITTPEMITLQFELAGIYSRALAFILDAALILVSLIAFELVAVPTLALISITLAYVVITLGSFIIIVGYFPIFEIYLRGRTPGKKVMGLQVIDADGRRLAAGAVIIRNMARLVDFLPELMLLGGLVAMADRWHRRIGDFAGQTVVIRQRRTALPAAISREMRRRDNSFLADPTIRARILERISVVQRDVIIDLALRRDQIEVSAREELFELAAGCMQKILRLKSDQYEHLSAEQYIINIAMVLQEGWFKG
ncbi:MAG: RDD family protein [Phycisphaerae bacterium]